MLTQEDRATRSMAHAVAVVLRDVWPTTRQTGAHR